MALDHQAAEDIELNGYSLDPALDAAAEANRAGLDPQEQLCTAIRHYLQSERERLGTSLHEMDPMAAVAEAWIRRKYTQHADARQRSMGLSYTSAETKDLGRAFARFCLEHAHLVATIARSPGRRDPFVITEGSDTLDGKTSFTMEWPDGTETVEQVGQNLADYLRRVDDMR